MRLRLRRGGAERRRKFVDGRNTFVTRRQCRQEGPMTSVHGSRTMGPISELSSRVSDLASVVNEERDEFDSSGRLSDGLFEQLARLGLFRLLLPAALGGPELSALEFMEVVEAAAALDGTVGWLVGTAGGG